MKRRIESLRTRRGECRLKEGERVQGRDRRNKVPEKLRKGLLLEIYGLLIGEKKECMQ